MNFFSNLALKWKLSLGFSVLMGLMMLVSTTVYSSLDKLQTTSEWVSHTHEAIRYGDQITASLINMETGLRGYLMAGNENFLEPYYLGQKEFQRLTAEAKQHVSDNPTQVERLDEVIRLEKEWQAKHVQIAMGMRKEVNQGTDAARTFEQISSRTVGKEKFDGFRAALSRLDEKFIQSNDIRAQSLVKLLLIDMINQETGQRGFLLSGVEASLEPYEAGKEAFNEHVESMNQLIQNAYDRVAARENIDSIQGIIDAWERRVALVGIELRKQSVEGRIPYEHVTEFVQRGTGKQFFDQSRENIDALTKELKNANDLLALELVTRLAKNMVDMETGYRGFLLTGKPSSLEPYNSGKVAFKETIEEINRLINEAYDVEEANTLLNAAVGLAKDWDLHAAIPEIDARKEMNQVTKTPRDVSDFVELGIGKQYMDTMRGELNEFIDAESALIEIRHAENQQTADNTTTITLVGTLLSMLFGGLLTFFIAKSITNTLKQAGDIANRIADDDLDTEIRAQSDDELGELIKGLALMQSKLKKRTQEERRTAAENSRIKQALDNVSGNVMILDGNQDIIYANAALQLMFSLAKELPSMSAAGLLGINISQIAQQQSHSFQKLETTERMSIAIGSRTYQITANPVNSETGERLGSVLEWVDRTDELAIEAEIQRVVDASRQGDLSQRIEVAGKQGFSEMLSRGINNLVDVSEQVINDSMRIMTALSNGDLTQSIQSEYRGSFNQLKQDANATVERLTEVMSEIRGGTDSVLTGSRQIADGNTNLSQRTEEQASSLENTSSSMEEMTITVKQNADSAIQANQLAESACGQAVQGREIVTAAVSAMTQITSSSEQIADIISVIDEIAFQTNLLALNAAVEAARAGEQGRGFAVVASEVRTLAGRSATAAKEIKELIEDSVIKVSEGARLVNDSGDTLEEITGSVTKVSEIIAQIASASAEQSLGIEQVNKAVNQLDQMTQQNAAMVEEAAVSSELMGQQAEKLKDLVAFFNSPDSLKPDQRQKASRPVPESLV